MGTVFKPISLITIYYRSLKFLNLKTSHDNLEFIHVCLPPTAPNNKFGAMNSFVILAVSQAYISPEWRCANALINYMLVHCWKKAEV
jgi:hypothetical protein